MWGGWSEFFGVSFLEFLFGVSFWDTHQLKVSLEVSWEVSWDTHQLRYLGHLSIEYN
jgi:hypothetical protein